jgi:hypothetical protein
VLSNVSPSPLLSLLRVSTYGQVVPCTMENLSTDNARAKEIIPTVTAVNTPGPGKLVNATALGT